MTREQFIGMLRSPSVIDLNRVKGLEDIAAQFPYFQNAHLLLARQYYGHENIRYDSYLKKAAVYAPDRKVLYKLIHLPATEVVHMNETPMEKVEAVVETIPEHKEIPIEPVIMESTHETVQIPEPDSVVRATASDTETISSKPSDDPRLVLEKRLKEIEQRTKPEVLHEPTAPAVSESISVKPLSPELKRPIDVAGSSQRAEAGAPQGMKMGFSEWLKLKSVPVAPVTDTRDYFSEALAHKEPISIPESKVIKDEKPVSDPGIIIEKFIREEPRIEPAKSEFYSPGNMARKSLIEHDDLISETLAKIYARQGNKQKAIEMYMKLGLKFPEKSAYFAALAEEAGKEE